MFLRRDLRHKRADYYANIIPPDCAESRAVRQIQTLDGKISGGQIVIEKRRLGINAPSVGCLGYGAMVLEGYYGVSDDEQAVRTIHRALDVGMNTIHTANACGNGRNEMLVGRAMAGMRQRAFVATKFGIVFDESESGTDLPTGWGFSLKINGRPSYVRKALNSSLKRLAVDVIDLRNSDPASRRWLHGRSKTTRPCWRFWRQVVLPPWVSTITHPYRRLLAIAKVQPPLRIHRGILEQWRAHFWRAARYWCAIMVRSGLGDIPLVKTCP